MNKRRKKSIQILYMICVLASLALFLYAALALNNRVVQRREHGEYWELTEYECVVEKDSNTPIGEKKIYTMELQEIPKTDSTLMFYTVHQSVEVYVEDELVYSMKPDEKNPVGKTPGNTWNTIPIYKEDAGRQIQIVIIPAYKSSEDIVPVFYFGSENGIWLDVLRKNFPAFVLGMIAVVVGGIFLIFILYNYRNPEVKKSLVMMGMFSVCVGIWKISDMASLSLMFPYSIALSHIPLLVLLLVTLPFLLYIKDLFSEKNHIIWYLTGFASIGVDFVTLCLQFAGIADLRETLWLNHLLMVIFGVVVFVMIIREICKQGWKGELRLMSLCAGACIAGMVADLIIYYFSDGTYAMIMGMFGFLIYIIVLGVRSIKRTRKLLSYGINAKKYRQLAYHDQLTGLYNRTAYTADKNKEDFLPRNYVVMMFDLNNLKDCNDTYGHEKGDNYIRKSAEFIEGHFGDIGRCYRMGGDEFCVLIKDGSLKICKERLQKMRLEILEYNQKHVEEYPIQIACGYVSYDEENDYNIEETLRRADEMMYHEKFTMKQEKNRLDGF